MDDAEHTECYSFSSKKCHLSCTVTPITLFCPKIPLFGQICPLSVQHYLPILYLKNVLHLCSKLSFYKSTITPVTPITLFLSSITTFLFTFILFLSNITPIWTKNILYCCSKSILSPQLPPATPITIFCQIFPIFCLYLLLYNVQKNPLHFCPKVFIFKSSITPITNYPFSWKIIALYPHVSSFYQHYSTLSKKRSPFLSKIINL